MNKLIERFSGLVKRSISGFDRIVFKGFILPLMSAGEVLRFCRTQGILNKDYKSWMMAQTENIGHADQYEKDQCGHGIIHIPTWHTRKETLANGLQQQEQISSGLIGVWSCLEAGSSYRSRYCAATEYPQLQNYQTRCNHLYFFITMATTGVQSVRRAPLRSLDTSTPSEALPCVNVSSMWSREKLRAVESCHSGQSNLKRKL